MIIGNMFVTIAYTNASKRQRDVLHGKEELEYMLNPIAEKFHSEDCPKGKDIVHVILPWLDDANDCIEVYIIRDKDGNISMSFD